MIDSKYIINGNGNYIKKDIRDMDVADLIEEIIETTKITALNLWGTNRERTNIAIDECAQKMKDIRLKADDIKLIDAFDNVMIAIRAFDNLNKILNAKVIRKSVQDIVEEMLDEDDESLTDVSDDNSCPTCDSDSDS